MIAITKKDNEIVSKNSLIFNFTSVDSIIALVFDIIDGKENGYIKLKEKEIL